MTARGQLFKGENTVSDYTPSMVLLGGLYLEHQRERLGERFDEHEAWAEFMQFVKNKQAAAWDEVADNLGEYAEVDDSLIHLADNIRDANPYRADRMEGVDDD